MAQHASDEIDLRYLYRKSKSGMRRMIRILYRIFGFYLKFWIVIVILIILGVAFGFYKDTSKKEVFVSKILVIPNAENADFLYDKIEATNRKIKAHDTVYLKENLGPHFKFMRSIKIEPVVDIYRFITTNEENLELLKIFAQNKDLTDYAENIITSKNYKYHTIEVNIQGEEYSKELIGKLLNSFNQNEHYLRYFEMFKEMKAFEVKEYEHMLRQYDSLIKAASVAGTANISGVAVNTSTNLHFLLTSKASTIKNLYQKRMELIDYTEPIKVVNVDYNLPIKSIFKISGKIKYPLLFIGLFSLFFLLRNMYSRMRRIAEQSAL